jgi:hypothetical protein
MDFDDLLESIADKAPSMRTNDTVHAGPGVWWKVVGDEKTPERHMVESDLFQATSTTRAMWNAVEFWYGTVLSVWGLLAGGLVLLALLFHRSPAARQLPLLLLFKPKAPPRRWFIINLIVLQLVAAVAILVTPATVQNSGNGGGDDYDDHHHHDQVASDVSSQPPTHWKLGPTACRAWLLGRMWISAAMMWASFAALFDRFLATVAPMPYGRWLGNPGAELAIKGLQDGGGGRAVAVVGLGMLATWLAAATVLVPTGLSMDRNDFILEEVLTTRCCYNNFLRRLRAPAECI